MSAISLSASYIPVAVYYEDADSVEYLRRDVPSVYKRVDGVLTLAYDMFTNELNGFRIKGFKNFYLRHLVQDDDVHDDHFLKLVSVIEKAAEVLGDGMFEHQEAYGKARDIALQDNVELHDLPVAA